MQDSNRITLLGIIMVNFKPNSPIVEPIKVQMRYFGKSHCYQYIPNVYLHATTFKKAP